MRFTRIVSVITPHRTSVNYIVSKRRPSICSTHILLPRFFHEFSHETKKTYLFYQYKLCHFLTTKPWNFRRRRFEKLEREKENLCSEISFVYRFISFFIANKVVNYLINYFCSHVKSGNAIGYIPNLPFPSVFRCGNAKIKFFV